MHALNEITPRTREHSEVKLIAIVEINGQRIALTCQHEGEAAILQNMLENPVILGKGNLLTAKKI
jgi:hypothetical protein